MRGRPLSRKPCPRIRPIDGRSGARSLQLTRAGGGRSEIADCLKVAARSHGKKYLLKKNTFLRRNCSDAQKPHCNPSGAHFSRLAIPLLIGK